MSEQRGIEALLNGSVPAPTAPDGGAFDPAASTPSDGGAFDPAALGSVAGGPYAVQDGGPVPHADGPAGSVDPGNPLSSGDAGGMDPLYQLQGPSFRDTRDPTSRNDLSGPDDPVQTDPMFLDPRHLNGPAGPDDPVDPGQPDPADPNIPDPSVPQIPDPNAPGQPDPSVPKPPDPNVPGQPAPNDPSVPDPSVPQIPDPNAPVQPNPKIPDPNVPHVPDPSVPQVPDPNAPHGNGTGTGTGVPSLPGLPASNGGGQGGGPSAGGLPSVPRTGTQQPWVPTNPTIPKNPTQTRKADPVALRTLGDNIDTNAGAKMEGSQQKTSQIHVGFPGFGVIGLGISGAHTQVRDSAAKYLQQGRETLTQWKQSLHTSAKYWSEAEDASTPKTK